MRKSLELPINIEVIERVGQISIIINFESSSVKEWCLGLVLLSEELIDSLSISNDLKSFHVEFRKDAHLSSSVRIQGRYIDRNINLLLSDNELGYWLQFFLKYYRDGVSVVDHIDADIVCPSCEGMSMDVTLTVANALPPVSPEEARGILGL
jgi:hypothetical protein